MSINPLSTTGTGAIPMRDVPARAPERSADRAVQVVRPEPTTGRPTLAPTGGRTLSAEPPAGVDPNLWQVLTADERTHFSRLSSMGPLTYGRGMAQSSAPQAPAVRGARLDIRI
jgi:hypothetical protein